MISDNPQYVQFRQKVLNRDSARNIFAFHNDQKFTQKDLNKKRRQLSLIVYPDKNPNCIKDAEFLFKCLQEAYVELQKKSKMS